MAEVELLPCPFCGGKAMLNNERECFGHGEYHTKHYVSCESCGARSSVEYEYYLSSEDCKVKVSEEWNTRARERKE